jgi:ribosome-binding protein aMBF1 (putative translation factor)
MECDLCGKEIEETFLGKIKGSVVKINEAGKNKIFNVCSDCQKKEKDIKAALKNK